MLSKYKLNQLYFKDTQFANLMTRRIFNVLLIANPYDAFMLEDDGRIDEKIFNEYTSLSLRYPPRFSQVSTEEEALTQLEKEWRNRNGYRLPPKESTVHRLPAHHVPDSSYPPLT